MAKGFSFEEALQPAQKGFSFEDALPAKPEPILSPEEQMMSSVGQTSGETTKDLAKLTAAGAVKGTLGAPEAVQSGLGAAARESLFAPTEALNYLADPRMLANKLVGSIGLSPIFEEKKLVPEQTTAKQKAAVDEVLTKGKIPQLKTLTEFGNKLSEDIESSISPEMKLALAESQPTGNILKALETGDFSEVSMGKNPTFLGLSGQAAKVFGSAMPAFLTAAITKSPGPAAAVGFGQAGAEGVDEARNYIGKMSDDELTKKSEYFRNLVALGYSPKDAKEMTIVKAGDTAALYQGTVGALGGAFTNKLLRGAFDKTLLASAKSRLAKIAQGTALGVTEGGLSEMAEGIATDLGIDKSVVREIGVDSFANLVLGALGEGAPGTVRGAIAPIESKAPFSFEQAVAPEAPQGQVIVEQAPPEFAQAQPITPVETAPARVMPGAIQEEDVEPLTPETVTAVTPPEVAPAPVAAAPEVVAPAEKQTFDEWRTQQGLMFGSKEEYQAALPQLQAQYQAEVGGAPAVEVVKPAEPVRELAGADKKLDNLIKNKDSNIKQMVDNYKISPAYAAKAFDAEVEYTKALSRAVEGHPDQISQEDLASAIQEHRTFFNKLKAISQRQKGQAAFAEDETGKKLTYPMFADMAEKGYQLYSFDNPRTYENKGGVKYRTLEKDGVRIALEPQQVLFTDPKKPNQQPQLGMGNEKDVAFHFIGVDPELRKEGRASEALKDLLKVADNNDYTLYGEPAQLEKEGMTKDQLVDLYTKYGFNLDESGKVMVRQPNALPRHSKAKDVPVIAEGETVDSTDPEVLKKFKEILETYKPESGNSFEGSFLGAINDDVKSKAEKIEAPAFKKGFSSSASLEVAPFNGGWVGGSSIMNNAGGYASGASIWDKVYPTKQEAINAEIDKLRKSALTYDNKKALTWLDSIDPRQTKEGKIEANKARQAEKKAKAEKPAKKVEADAIPNEEKMVDAIQSMAYKNNTSTKSTANDFIAKFGRKMFDDAVKADLLDNEPGEGRLFPSNNYAYKVVSKYYDAKGKKIKAAKEEKPKAVPAKEVHIEGKKSEPVTSKTIEESFDKAVTKVDSKKIKSAIKNQFDQAIKRSEIVTEEEFNKAKLPDSKKFVTIDVPGDGKFKVKNNKENLEKLQKRLMNATSLKVGAAKRDSIMAVNASSPAVVMKGMLADGELENALEYGKLNKLDPYTIGMSPIEMKNLEKAFGGERGQLEYMAEIQGKPVEKVETYQESMDRINAEMKAEGRESDFAKAAKELAETKAKIKELEAKKAPAKLIGEEKTKAPTKKEKETAYKQKLKDLLQSDVGDAITFNQDIEYASKDTPYTITGAGEKSFGIYNPANDSRTTINYSTLLRQKGRGLVWEKAKEVEEKPLYTAKERENAEHHAKDIGGEVVWQKGDLSLIRGYQEDNGAPAYIVARGDLRGRTIIQDYRGDLVNNTEKADLIKVAEAAEKVAQEKHKINPFIQFKDGISLSKDIPSDLGGAIKEWKKLFGLKANIYVSTIEDAKENRNNFTGPHRVVGSGTLAGDRDAGSMRRMPDNSYYVLFSKSTSKTKMLETIAHELGHVHEREVYIGASPEMKKALNAEFQKWVMSQKGKTARDLVDSLRAKTSAKTTNIPVGQKASDLNSYWTRFGEWYADQTARWAVSSDKPLTVVEKFFTRLGNQMRRFYNNLTNKGYLPTETFKQYMDSMVDSKDPVADVGEDYDSAPQAMAKKIIPRADEIDALLEKHDRGDTPLHPSGEVKDALLGSYQKSKKIATKMSENPLMTAVNMVGKADRAITYARNKNVWFGSGLDQADFARYNGQLRNSQGLAAASVAVTNAIHAGHVGTQVMVQGGLEFDPKTQMFRAKKSSKSLANVVTLKHDLEEKLGAQRAANVVNAYFEAKRSRSIVNEFLNREAAYEEALDSGEDSVEAAKNLKNIEVAMQKVSMSDEAIDDFIALDKEYPELRKMMDNWTAVNQNMLDMMEFSGVISKKRAANLRAIEDYVPWYRIMDDQADIHTPAGVRGMTNVGQEKKFKAGEVDRDIDDIVDNMIHNVMMMTRNSMKNYAANRVAMEYATRKENGKIQLYPTEGADANGVRTNIIINGRRAIVNIPDPLVAEAVLGMENIDIPMINILAVLANGLRRGITTFPVFQVSQLFMDAPTAALVSGVKSPFKLIGNTFGGFVRALLPGDPIVAMLKSYGIGGYQSSARTPEKELKIEIGLLDKSVWARGLKLLDNIGDASDYAQRRAIYKQVLKETGDEMQALIQANNVIDFLKRGSGKGAQFVTRTVSFMNAYAQSIDVLAQALAGGGLKGKSRKAAQAQMIKTGMLLVGTTLLYCMAVGADDEYDKLDDQTKLRNIIIPGTKIRLPMHTSASFFFKAIPELIYNKVMKEGTKNQIDNTRLRKALGEAAIDSLLSPNLTPTGIKPFAEIALNHNFFTGGTVTPKGMEKLESFRQYTSATSEMGKVISALTMGALNPIEADHIVRGLFGTAGAAVMYGSNLFSGDRVAPQAKDNPLYGSFILPDVPRGREDLFYDLKERSDKKYETFNDLMKKQRTREGQEFREENKALINAHGFVTQADADLKRINAEIRRLSDLPEAQMSSAEKRAKITRFQETKNNILEQTIKFRLKAGL
jgi:hypothetical protein